MTILHLIAAYLTIPGTVLRAFLEHLFLKAEKVPVEDTGYLQQNELCGHVEHKPVTTFGKGGRIAFLPGLILFVVGFCVWAVSAIQLFYLGVTPKMVETGKVSGLFILCVVLLYAGASLLSRIFPTYEDVLYLWEAYTEQKVVIKVLLFLPMILLRAGAFLERFGIWTLCVFAVSIGLFFI